MIDYIDVCILHRITQKEIFSLESDCFIILIEQVIITFNESLFVLT